MLLSHPSFSLLALPLLVVDFPAPPLLGRSGNWSGAVRWAGVRTGGGRKGIGARVSPFPLPFHSPPPPCLSSFARSCAPVLPVFWAAPVLSPLPPLPFLSRILLSLFVRLSGLFRLVLLFFWFVCFFPSRFLSTCFFLIPKSALSACAPLSLLLVHLYARLSCGCSCASRSVSFRYRGHCAIKH